MPTPRIGINAAASESTLRCAAHLPEGKQRGALALYGLAGPQPISTLSTGCIPILWHFDSRQPEGTQRPETQLT
jgi:hypothetical protein